MWSDPIFAQGLATQDYGCGYVCCMFVIAIGCSGNDVDDRFITVKYIKCIDRENFSSVT